VTEKNRGSLALTVVTQHVYTIVHISLSPFSETESCPWMTWAHGFYR